MGVYTGDFFLIFDYNGHFLGSFEGEEASDEGNGGDDFGDEDAEVRLQEVLRHLAELFLFLLDTH